MKSNTLNSLNSLNTFSETFSIYALVRSSGKTIQTIQNPSESPKNNMIKTEQLETNYSDYSSYRKYDKKLGFKWCRQHQAALMAAGWNEAELFNPKWPLGLAHLALWDKPGLQLVLDGGLVRFRWTRTDGGQVEQVGRPDAEVTI